jgi:Protein of unknown function (DUF973)
VSGPLPPGTYPSGFQQLAPAPPSPGPADAVALSSVAVAALITVVGAVVSIVVGFTGALSTVTDSTTGGSSFSSSVGEWTVLGVVALAVALGLVEIYLYRRAFAALAPRDDRFRWPRALASLLLVSLVLLLVLFAWTLSIIGATIACAAGASTIPPSCVPATIFLAGGLLLLVAVAAIVGFVGVLLGIWRLGARYRDGRFKVGAILLIIPLVSIAGAVLIFLAARAAGRRVPPPASYG